MALPSICVRLAVVCLGASVISLPVSSAVAQSAPTNAQRVAPVLVHLISGVVREPGGQPLAGVCVAATGTSGATTISKTAADGRYVLAVSRPGDYLLAFRDCRLHSSQPPPSSGQVIVPAATRAVAVAGSGVTPVASVTLGQATRTSELRADLAAAGVTFPAAPRQVRLGVSRAAATTSPGVAGRVTGPSGKPLAGICAWVESQYAATGVTTARNGTYAIGSGSISPGVYLVEFTSNCDSFPFPTGPWAPEWYKDKFSSAAATKVHVRRGHITRNINAVMQRNGEISGTVTGAKGKRLAGVCVVLTTANGSEVSQATTNARGRYLLTGLDPGHYRALFAPACSGPSDYANSWWPNATTLAGARAISVRLGHVTRGVNARLQELGTITGDVRLHNKSGSPLGGMCVSAFSRNPSLPIGFAATSAKGRYKIEGLPAGAYQIEANPGCNNNGNYATATYPRLIKVVDGKTVSGIDVYLQPGGTVSGTVTSAATGKPLGGICVADDNGNFGVTTAKGTYAIDQLSAERTTMTFAGGCGSRGSYAPEWYPNQPNQASAGNVTITAGHETENVNAAMQPGATISGRTTWRTGKPAGGVCVAVVPPGFVGLQLGDIGAEVVTGGAGRYTIANLEPGDYAMAFYGGCAVNAGLAGQQWYPDQPTDETAAVINARAGQPVSGIDASVARGGMISGTVTGPTGQPIQFACVTAVNSRTGLAGGNDNIAVDGNYNVAGLAPGHYSVVVTDCTGGALADGQYPHLVTVRPGHNTGLVNLVMPRGGVITGRITVRGSKAPARGVCVSARTANPLLGGVSATGPQGRYRIIGLNSGRYRITVTTTGGCQEDHENLASATLPGEVRVRGGSVTSGVDGSLGQGGSIAGAVSDPGGHAVPGACVEVFAPRAGLEAATSTEANGRYLASGLTPGRYKVLLGDPSCSYGPANLADQWYEDSASSATATVVTVAAGHVRGGVDAQLGSDGTVTGSVTGPGSENLTGICVSAVPVARYASTVYTVASGGSYEITDLAPGRYRVEFQSDCGLTGWKTQWWDDAASSKAATVITVGAGAVISDVSAVMARG